MVHGDHAALHDFIVSTVTSEAAPDLAAVAVRAQIPPEGLAALIVFFSAL